MDMLDDALTHFLARPMDAAPDMAAGVAVFAGLWIASVAIRRVPVPNAALFSKKVTVYQQGGAK